MVIHPQRNRFKTALRGGKERHFNAKSGRLDSARLSTKLVNGMTTAHEVKAAHKKAGFARTPRRNKSLLGISEISAQRSDAIFEASKKEALNKH